MSEQGHGNDHDHGPSHYIKIWAVLLVLLIISICGPLAGIRIVTLLTAFGIAIVKAVVVAREFMHLKLEKKIITEILLGMLALVAIFFYGVAPDVLKQTGQNWLKMDPVTLSHAYDPIAGPVSAKSKLTNPWISTPELIAHGKEVFAQNCVLCHGPLGHGDGIGGVSLNPKPRNFTSATDKWVNGRTVLGVFKTLQEGVKGSGMASFSTLPVDDRWALDHFVLSLGPTKVPTPTAAELAKANVSAGEATFPSVPVDFIIPRMVSEASSH